VGTLGGELLEYWNATFVDRAAVILTRAALALLAVGAVWLLGRVLLRMAQRALERSRAHVNARLLIGRLIHFGLLLAGGAWALSILGVQLTALVAVLGAAALAVSLALQDVLKNLVAGLYILVERPFAIGEQIEFKTYSGTVESIELRTTALRTEAGQRVMIPNAMLFAEALVNRSAYGRQIVRLRVVLPGAETRREETAAVLAAAQGVLAEAGDASVRVESMSGDKVTLRVEGWSPDARRAAPEVAWALRDAMPHAEITVLE
jgi:small-conductance mechanosensitive channel